uniref:Uncharacterized protein n=1 Tax=Siphoviridae sp. ctrpM6 TaxID=2827956 RepID=A0A8S5T3U6_9CAUD|nr:MAG TPA: hypothetical protein [Siphoviridae sp. ctrpM6]
MTASTRKGDKVIRALVIRSFAVIHSVVRQLPHEKVVTYSAIKNQGNCARA